MNKIERCSCHFVFVIQEKTIPLQQNTTYQIQIINTNEETIHKNLCGHDGGCLCDGLSEACC